MIKMNMKQAARFLMVTFSPTDKIICVMEGPTNSKWQKSEESISWDTCAGMIKTLTDPEVCDTNEDLYYFTIAKAYMVQGELAMKLGKMTT